MHEWESLSHVRWDCTYPVVIVPKYRRKVLYRKMKGKVGKILRELCQQKGVELVEGHAKPDPVHMCVRIPPKYSVAFTLGFLKGKSAVRIHRELLGERRMTGLHFWARGYCVSTVGLDEQQIRQYLREQEDLEKHPGELWIYRRCDNGPYGAFPMCTGPLGGGLPHTTRYAGGR